jgi:hypothetical protein
MVMSTDRAGKYSRRGSTASVVKALSRQRLSLRCGEASASIGNLHLSERTACGKNRVIAAVRSISRASWTDNRGMKGSSKSIRAEPPGDAGKHGENDIACRAMSAICRLSVPLAVIIFNPGVAVAEPLTVGAVDKVQAHVDATQTGQTRPLVINSDIYFRDRCHSGEGARLQVTLKDGTQLTLGEHATLMVDEFIYDPSRSRGELSVSVIRGAFLYVGGRIEGVNGATVQIHTPVGAIGLLGTTVWGGPIDNGYGVIVLNGQVTVTGRRGTMTLKQGQGTMVFGRGKPQRAAAWPADRMKRAVASITFGKP